METLSPIHIRVVLDGDKVLAFLHLKLILIIQVSHTIWGVTFLKKFDQRIPKLFGLNLWNFHRYSWFFLISGPRIVKTKNTKSANYESRITRVACIWFYDYSHKLPSSRTVSGWHRPEKVQAVVVDFSSILLDFHFRCRSRKCFPMIRRLCQGL